MRRGESSQVRLFHVLIQKLLKIRQGIVRKCIQTIANGSENGQSFFVLLAFLLHEKAKKVHATGVVFQESVFLAARESNARV